MKKRFYLTMTLLLTLAVGTSYADDDPSVFTLIDAPFADNFSSFNYSLEPTSEFNNYGCAWKINQTLGCAECSDTDDNNGRDGFLWNTGITYLKWNRCFDVRLTFEHAGTNIESASEIKIWVAKIVENTRKFEQIPSKYYEHFVLPNSSDEFISCGYIRLDDYMCGEPLGIGISFTPSKESNKIYYVKNLKLTCHNYPFYSDIKNISQFGTLDNLNEGSVIKSTFSNTKVIWADENYVYLNDGSKGVQAERNRYPINTLAIGDVISGEMYASYEVNDGIPELMNPCITSLYSVENDQDYSAVMIGEDDYWENVMRYVKMPITSNIQVWDRNKIYGTYQFRNYTPVYESYFTGLLIPDKDGNKRFMVTGNKSIEIALPDVMETALSSNELGLYAKVNRSFTAGEWYSLCLPFEYENPNMQVANFISSYNGIMEFRTYGNEVQDGKPFLVKFDVDSGGIEGTITYKNADNITNGEYNFVGTLQTVSPKDGSLYLTAGNTIKPLATGGRINAFRGYFGPNTPAAARTRSIVIDGTTIATGDGTTDIEDILNGRTNDEGEVYNLNGQRVTGNSYSKGIYIINGKKVIK